MSQFPYFCIRWAPKMRLDIDFRLRFIKGASVWEGSFPFWKGSVPFWLAFWQFCKWCRWWAGTSGWVADDDTVAGLLESCCLRFSITCSNVILLTAALFSVDLKALSRLDLPLFSSKSCQAQPQLQVKLSLKAELALFSINPAPTHPPGFFFKHFYILGPKLEDDLNFLGKWKTTLMF